MNSAIEASSPLVLSQVSVMANKSYFLSVTSSCIAIGLLMSLFLVSIDLAFSKPMVILELAILLYDLSCYSHSVIAC